MNQVYEAGGFYEKNPYYYPNEALAQEKAKADCCLNYANCPVYYSTYSNVLDNCERFVQQRIGKFCLPIWLKGHQIFSSCSTY